jgi:hypothetical protein
MHRVVWAAFLISRLVVIATSMAARIDFGAAAAPAANSRRAGGYITWLFLSSVQQWDSSWFLSVATRGYGVNKSSTAFYPLYPAATHVMSWLVGSPATAGFLLSLVAFVAGLYVTYALVRLDFAEDVAAATVLLLAFFPTSLFFSAVYSESLFFLLSVTTIYEARRGRWVWAGVFGFFAALTRNSGVFLVLPVAILMLYGPCADGGRRLASCAGADQRKGWRVLLPRFRPPWRAIATLLIPCGLLTYLAFLQVRYGWGLAPFHAETAWGRGMTDPFTGLLRSASAAYDGVRQLLHGPQLPTYSYDPVSPGVPTIGSLVNILMFGFLLLGIAGTVGIFHRQPLAYGVYASLVVLLSLAEPMKWQPLTSLPRFLMVVFPFFIWAAERLQRRGWLPYVLGASSVLLGYCTTMFATSRFVA